ncbi:exosome complex exonuclease RRP42 [Pyrus ussuriensis x Pyrus communis]|uniref:Exosome complex exonuclease RRP42 n=1 Tax=Pyrus ussuriensis x Pyrus communis TaxID=2448454 RepID=A0A5N5GRT5_9ROSA|nr:exosome complex exonuclease RRP42 [Pyrus ussuriensis x Pyrus communis]
MLQAEVDVSNAEFLQFDTSKVHVIVTLTKVGEHYIVDATSEEESQMNSAVSISVNRQGRICGLTKRGGAGLDPSIILDLVSVARTVVRAGPSYMKIVIPIPTQLVKTFDWCISILLFGFDRTSVFQRNSQQMGGKREKRTERSGNSYGLVMYTINCGCKTGSTNFTIYMSNRNTADLTNSKQV